MNLLGHGPDLFKFGSIFISQLVDSVLVTVWVLDEVTGVRLFADGKPFGTTKQQLNHRTLVCSHP